MLLELTGLGRTKVLYDYNLEEWVNWNGRSQNLCLELNIFSGNITFAIATCFDAEVLEKGSEAEKKRIAFEGIKLWKKLLKRTPKGTMFYCNAYEADGKGLKREKLYMRMGFRKIGKDLVYIHK